MHGRTQQECQQALDDLCQSLSVSVTMLPTDMLGGRWIARVARQEAPDPEARGFAMR